MATVTDMEGGVDKKRVSENTPAFQVTRAWYPFSPPPEGRSLGDVHLLALSTHREAHSPQALLLHPDHLPQQSSWPKPDSPTHRSPGKRDPAAL